MKGSAVRERGRKSNLHGTGKNGQRREIPDAFVAGYFRAAVRVAAESDFIDFLGQQREQLQ